MAFTPPAARPGPAAPHDLPLGPPTGGKTPIPGKYVTLKTDVKVGKGQTLGFTKGKGYYAKTVPVGRPGPGGTPPPLPPHKSYTAAEEATLHAKQLLAPLYSQADVEAKRQNDSINAYTKAVMQALGGEAPQIGQDYNTQINAQSQMVNNAADSLRAVNPTGDVQHLLDAVGAPAAQGQQIAGNLNNTFNGGAAVGQYVNGVSPLGALRSQGLAAESLARLQPGFTALAGHQGLLSALKQQADARAAIGAQLPKLSQDWLTQFQNNKNAQTQFQIERDAAGLKQGNSDRTFGLSVAKYKAAQDKYLRDYNFRVTQFNSKQTSDAAKLQLPNASLSRVNGYLTAADGTPIVGSNGKRQILPGFKVNAQGQIIKVGTTKSGAKGASVSQVNSFLKGLVSYKSVRTTDGTGGSTSTKEANGHTMTYQAALRRLRNMGQDDQTARQNLNSVYKRGEDGRAWLTNVEQAVLRKAATSRGSSWAGLKGSQRADILTVSIDPVSKHRFLSPAQYQILKAAGQLPGGAFQDTPLGKRWYIAQ